MDIVVDTSAFIAVIVGEPERIKIIECTNREYTHWTWFYPMGNW